jgi:signal peptidase I
VTQNSAQSDRLPDDRVPDDKESTTHWFVDLLRTWGPPILGILVLRTFVFEPFRIPSGSMVPTLLIGDHVVVNKASYGLWAPATGIEIPLMDSWWVPPRYRLIGWGAPARGDIIVFRFPENESLNYIKRVVGLPGDHIRVKNNQPFIDGVAQDREYQDRFDFVDDNCSVSPTKRYIEELGGELKHDILTNPGVPGPLATIPRNETEDIVVPPDSVFVMGDNRDNSEDSRRWGFVRYDQIKGKAHFVGFSWDGCAGGVRSDRFFKSLYGAPQ